ncbi:DUF1302 domain-containing protein [Pseudomonas sp. H9]|uniref:DUF1302 domain-containing protein n=1 Tax=Pseudomonas sp. H9 TaxID=483968 RepID=UPI001057FE10|nr:DUF1302 domain-containing protein [Pseudomonas sp. H9]TDF83783.1 DUF1302 domain-containing protein [Pseudomonas sp. H9]
MKDSAVLNTTTPHFLRPSMLAVGITLAANGIPAQAASFQFDEDWNLNVNTTLSLGTSWSLEGADKKLMTKSDAARIGKDGRGSNLNGDDGKLNFDKGDTISTVFKGITDLDLNDGSQGAFVRFKYWYDDYLENNEGDWGKVGLSGQFNDDGWQDLAKFKGFEALDAYVWKDFDIGGHRLNAKLGKQVISWGEALFLQNGVNAINPLDVSAFNRPGVELKEGQLPVEMLSMNFDVTDAMSIEGFWQYNFRPSVFDGCGTFFSAADSLQEGCQFDKILSGGSTESALNAGTFIPRASTDWARDTGQYGLALHYVFEELNNTDLGIYYANYHSRSPVGNGIATTGSGTAASLLNNASYFTSYPEDIRMFGASLSTVLGSTAVFGELSYRPNQPVGLNSNDLVAYFATRATNTPIASVAPAPGSRVNGYERLPVWQFSLGATDTVSNVLGAQRFAWATEAGANWVDDIDGQRFGRAGGFGRTAPTNASTCTAVPAPGATGSGGLSRDEIIAFNADNCNTKGLVNHFSWGYRARFSLAYEGLLPATTLTPAITWRHDVEGNGPNFQEGQQAVGLSLTVDYRNNYSLELAYNEFFGTNEFSTIDDRDFASVTVKASF